MNIVTLKYKDGTEEVVECLSIDRSNIDNYTVTLLDGTSRVLKISEAQSVAITASKRGSPKLESLNERKG